LEASISTRRLSDGGVVVEVRGELDMASAGGLREAVGAAVNAWHPPYLTVDLLYVTLLDSAGISALVAGHQTARAVGCRLRVRNPNPLTYHQLRVTGLDEVLDAGPPPPPQDRYADPNPRPA
jgi:anti-sigma B factor antagonist